MKMTGGCQCGTIRYEAEIEKPDAYLCHCRMCQRATGGVSIAFVNVKRDSVSWSRDPAWYSSSPIAKRPFCATCGTPLGFMFNEGENIDLTVGSFDEPGYFRPTSNFGVETKHSSWQDTSGLPEMRCDQFEPLQKRWRDAGATPPT